MRRVDGKRQAERRVIGHITAVQMRERRIVDISRKKVRAETWTERRISQLMILSIRLSDIACCCYMSNTWYPDGHFFKLGYMAT